jgi:hypothetical protein
MLLPVSKFQVCACSDETKNRAKRRVKIDLIESILNLKINIKAMLFKKEFIGQLACSYSPKRNKNTYESFFK